MNPESRADSARALHQRVIVIDGTCPLANRVEYLQHWIQGGVTALAPSLDAAHGVHGAIQSIGQWRRIVREDPGRLLHVTSAADILRAKRERKLGIIFHFQDTDPVEDCLDLLEVYRQLGVRVMQLTYNRKNRVGDGCEERTDCGLSRFGVRLIEEMNRLGMIVDLSHAGYRTALDAIEWSSRPPIFSHSNCKAVCDSPRNVADDQIRAVAQRGGMIGVNGFPSFVAHLDRPTVAHVIAHIDHIVDLVGPDHVGLGIDYYEGMASVATPDQARRAYERHLADGVWTPDSYPPPPWHYPRELELPSGLPHLTEALLDHGYCDEDVAKILGGNYLRVFQAVCG